MSAVLTGILNKQRIDEGVQRALSALESDVIRIRYSVEEDWSGDPAIFFRVVLRDRASAPSRLHEVAQNISEAIEREVRPDLLGLEAYFHVRSDSEQKQLRDKDWE